MKKLLSVILCVAMLVTLTFTTSMIAFAADQSTTITTTVEPTYTVSIPADTDITFGATSTDFGEVKLTEANLESGYSVKVTVNAGALTNAAGNEIDYTVKSGESAFASAEYDAVGEKTDLTIAISQSEWDNAKAGSYTGTVTFTVEYSVASGS